MLDYKQDLSSWLRHEKRQWTPFVLWAGAIFGTMCLLLLADKVNVLTIAQVAMCAFFIAVGSICAWCLPTEKVPSAGIYAPSRKRLWAFVKCLRLALPILGAAITIYAILSYHATR